jgi:hypothetical protein
MRGYAEAGAGAGSKSKPCLDDGVTGGGRLALISSSDFLCSSSANCLHISCASRYPGGRRRGRPGLVVEVYEVSAECEGGSMQPKIQVTGQS